VKFALRTLRGRFAVEWCRLRGGLAVDITIPANASATVRLPGRDPRQVTESGRPLAKAPGVSLACVRGGRVEMRVGSGTYRFRVGTC
jgi:alpha-L-rhamnosidase